MEKQIRFTDDLLQADGENSWISRVALNGMLLSLNSLAEVQYNASRTIRSKKRG